MPRYSIPLTANEAIRLPYPGKFLQIVDPGDATTVNVQVEWGINQQDVENYGPAPVNFTIDADERFMALELLSTVDTTVDLLVSNRKARISDGQGVNATIVNPLPVPVSVSGPNPLPVANDRGDSALTPVYVTGVLSEDAPAANITDNAAVAAGPVAAALLAADATRLEFVAYNIGPDPVAIGMAGITWAKRAIVLNAGDTWIERRGAAKAWEVITDAAKAGSVTVQERKS